MTWIILDIKKGNRKIVYFPSYLFDSIMLNYMQMWPVNRYNGRNTNDVSRHWQLFKVNTSNHLPSDSDAARKIKWSFGRGMPIKAPASSPLGPWKQKQFNSSLMIRVDYTILIYVYVRYIFNGIFNGTENLPFDKEGYFHVLVFYGLFYKRNRKHFYFHGKCFYFLNNISAVKVQLMK